MRFSTYGVPMIAGEIRRYLRDNSPLRVSRSLRDTAYRVLQCREELVLAGQSEPTSAQIAERLGIAEKEVTASLDAIAAPISLFEPVYDQGGDPLTVMDQVRDCRNTDEHWLERLDLREAVKHEYTGYL